MCGIPFINRLSLNLRMGHVLSDFTKPGLLEIVIFNVLKFLKRLKVTKGLKVIAKFSRK